MPQPRKAFPYAGHPLGCGPANDEDGMATFQLLKLRDDEGQKPLAVEVQGRLRAVYDAGLLRFDALGSMLDALVVHDTKISVLT